METIKETINKLVEKINSDLINNKYILLEISTHTSTLIYGEDTLIIWTANGEKCCSMYGKINGLELPEFNDEIKSHVFKLATTPTEFSIKRKLDKKEIELLEIKNKYESTLSEFEKIKKELSDIKK